MTITGNREIQPMEIIAALSQFYDGLRTEGIEDINIQPLGEVNYKKEEDGT